MAAGAPKDNSLALGVGSLFSVQDPAQRSLHPCPFCIATDIAITSRNRAAAKGPVLFHLTLNSHSDAAFQKPVTPHSLTPHSPLKPHSRLTPHSDATFPDATFLPDAAFPADAALRRHILWRKIFG